MDWWNFSCLIPLLRDVPVAIKGQKFPRDKKENVIAFEREDEDVHHIPRQEVGSIRSMSSTIKCSDFK